jgi:hypothetical protein
MRAARRVGVRGAVFVGAVGALVGLGVYGCQFPEYDLARGPGGQAGNAIGGFAEDPAGGAAAEGNTAGMGGAGGTPTIPPRPCGIGKACASELPAGWLGPVAYWQAKVGELAEPPDCPDGYVDPSDLHTGLDAPDGDCSCSCTSTDQVCDKGANVSVFVDLGCQTECSQAAPLACTAISGCNGSQGSVLADPRTPSGSCEPKVTSHALEPVSWQYDARLCSLETAEMGTCTGTGELCAPTPRPPFASQLCVFRVVPEGQDLPECPAAYPNARDPLFGSFTDERACSTCSCSAPKGGRCSGKLTLSTGQSCGNTFEYTLGSGCKPFGLSTPPTQLGAEYTLVPGTCGIADDTEPTGGAIPSGSATVVCCS